MNEIVNYYFSIVTYYFFEIINFYLRWQTIILDMLLLFEIVNYYLRL